MSDVSRETPLCWLTVVGLGDGGADHLPPASRALIAAADCVIGGHRLLDHVAAILAPGTKTVPWTDLTQTVAAILERRGRPTVVLATGDPMHFGLGSTLARALFDDGLDQAEWQVIAAPGAFSLAAARMGWPLQDCRCLTVHGRPLDALRLHLAPGQKLLVLSATEETPPHVAALLAAEGYGPSSVTVLSHMGGVAEQRFDALAHDFPKNGAWARLNTLAIDCRLASGRRPRSAAPGLPDDAFEHDGQITKQEVRAVTLAALAPWPGALLWDVGSGSGSIAIEWMRAAPGTQALAIEQDALRLGRIGRNAHALGVPGLRPLLGKMPGLLSVLDEDEPRAPDAIFVGGGVSQPGLLEKLWARLAPGGRLVANAVTLQAEQAVLTFYQTHGGTLRRLAVSRLVPVGTSFERWDSLAPVTQLCAEKA
jgi:precorrin-6Y C5,15-methyltransferase (decarboxylating)